MTDPLYGVDDWVILLALFASLLVAAEVGFRLACRVQSSTKPQIPVVATALLGILALLLGFTVSMVVSRFEVRRQLVLAEANAIGTAYARTQLLPTPQSTELANLLREYVDVRLQYGDAGVPANRSQDEAKRKQAARLQDELWSRAAAYGRQDPNPVRAGFLLQSLNLTIELEAARWMAFLNTVPETVIYDDAIVALLAASVVGFLFGTGGRRQIFSVCVLALAITVVLGVIVDLDRPRSGFIRVNQQPMIDLQHRLQEPK